jgi:hypothetical protein
VGQLIDQLCNALNEWNQRTEYGDSLLPVLFKWTGGLWKIRKEAELTLENLKVHLEALCFADGVHLPEVGLDEAFMVKSLIAAADEVLKRRLSFATLRETYENFEAIYADPGARTLVIAQLNAQAAPPVAQRDEAAFRRFLDEFKAVIDSTGFDVQKRTTAYMLWQELTAPILARENVEAAERAIAAMQAQAGRQ